MASDDGASEPLGDPHPDKAARGALSGVTVLDLSRILAGPWACQTLADLGAEVIKIERPGAGDDTRSWGPPELVDSLGASASSAYFNAANRGKKSVAIDIASEAGQRLVRELARGADVVVENFKVGGLKKYGLDYESVRAINPGVVYCSITGFGQTGPYASRAGYDFLIQGMGGLMSVTGQPDGAPGDEPMKVGVALADILTGLYAAIGVLAALRHRDATGEGQHIDMALLDVQVATLANQAMNFLASGQAPRRLGNAHPNIVPYQVFAAADGHLILTAGNDGQFQRFCAVAELDAVAADPRFASNPARVAHRDVLIPVLAEAIGAKPLDWWLTELESAGVPAGPINTLDRVFADPQVAARELVRRLPTAAGGLAPSVASPLKLSATPVAYRTAAPALGQHTEAVLSERLGLSAEARADLIRDGVAGAPFSFADPSADKDT